MSVMSMSENHPTAASKQDVLRVKLESGGQVPFNKGTPIDTLEATIAPILGQLVYTSNSYDLEPGLLEAFKWDHEKEAYILRIKAGLKFHNGRKVTAKDLEFSILRGFYSGERSFFIAFLDGIEGIEAITGSEKFFSGKVKGIKILDERTLSIKLKRKNPLFLHSLATPYFSLVPIEAFTDNYERWKDVPIGAGSYKVKAHNQEAKTLTLSKVSEAKSAKEITLYYGNEPYNADIELSMPAKNLQVVASKRAAGLTSINFNFNNPIASDVRFRKAINLAIDRNTITAGVETYTPVHEFLAQHFWGRTEVEVVRNTEAAKKLLKSVSSLDLTKHYEIPIFYGSLDDEKYGGYIRELVKQLAEIGLKIKPVSSTAKFFPPDNKDTLFRLVSLGASVADPLILFGLFRGEKSPKRPHFPLHDNDYENLFQKAQHSSTLEQRVAAVKNLSQYLQDNVWLVPLFEKKLLVSVDPKRVKSVGVQDGGITFFLERTTLH